jgi:hypothetical protein
MRYCDVAYLFLEDDEPGGEEEVNNTPKPQVCGESQLGKTPPVTEQS